MKTTMTCFTFFISKQKLRKLWKTEELIIESLIQQPAASVESQTVVSSTAQNISGSKVQPAGSTSYVTINKKVSKGIHARQTLN